MGLLDKVKEVFGMGKPSGQAQPGADQQPGTTQDTGEATPGAMPDGGADTSEPPAGGDTGI